MKSAAAYFASALVFLAALALAATVVFLAPAAVHAQSTSVPIDGYAWSDTIGWIDLNCANSAVCSSDPFGLSIDQNGTITGYAWSDNIGWVSANPSDLSGCPPDPCTAMIQNGTLTGWLRALSGGESQAANWDGFVSLGGKGSDGSPSGVLLANGAFSGFAWGDLNVGWIDFADASTQYGTCTPAYACSGDTIEYTDSSCIVTDVTTCQAPAFCSAGSPQCLYPSMTFTSFTDSNGQERSGNLQVAPTLVPRNTTTTVYWNVQNAQSCTVTGNGNSWSGTSSGASGEVSNPIAAQLTYTLTCIDDQGSTTTESASVNVVPIYQEK
jgi:hypothetical protein